MIEPKEALDIILNNVKSLPAKKVFLEKGLGHVLVNDIKAKIEVPLFDNSAMDGFAIHKQDLGTKNCLKVIGEVKAGQKTSKVASKGKAISIMTGAPVPKGAAAVIPIENVDEDKKKKTIDIKSAANDRDNIRNKGEDIKKGSVLIKKGTILKPIHIALAASVGVSEVKVFEKPKVSIVVTGNELKRPGTILKAGELYDSNSFLLKSLLLKNNFDVAYVAKTKDNLDKTIRTIRKAIEKADVVLTTGGISVGKYDFVSLALEKIGAKRFFNKVKQKPGKPLSFFTYQNKAIISLPGNPVAVATCFEIYAKPMLKKMSGTNDLAHKEIKAEAAQPLKRHKKRTNYIRVNLIKKNGSYVAKTTGFQGSGVLSSMLADGIAVLQKGNENLKQGELVKVIDLEGNYK
ncbi:MAG: molybdopterin molybdotransferase MoeA [Actinobacteria bacterium]|nr:MAG: molybdopterin molybdotransferase MoeA [Actinomycetota bacterium]